MEKFNFMSRYFSTLFLRILFLYEAQIARYYHFIK